MTGRNEAAYRHHMTKISCDSDRFSELSVQVSLIKIYLKSLSCLDVMPESTAETLCIFTLQSSQVGCFIQQSLQSISACSIQSENLFLAENRTVTACLSVELQSHAVHELSQHISGHLSVYTLSV
jgi:hypothetical protein